MSRLTLLAVAFVVAASGVAQSQPVRKPDPAVTYAVPLGASPEIGAPSAKVTIVMAIDFSCPYCRDAWGTVSQLLQTYGADLRVVFKPFVVHPKEATAAAYAACAADKQGKWREMAELLWTDAFDVGNFDPVNIATIAVRAGLDPEKYQHDITGACPAQVRADMALLQRFGVRGTPSFFINGRYVAGASRVQGLIDEELAKANAAIDGGVPAEQVYEQLVIEKGVSEVPAS